MSAERNKRQPLPFEVAADYLDGIGGIDPVAIDEGGVGPQSGGLNSLPLHPTVEVATAVTVLATGCGSQESQNTSQQAGEDAEVVVSSFEGPLPSPSPEPTKTPFLLPTATIIGGPTSTSEAASTPTPEQTAVVQPETFLVEQRAGLPAIVNQFPLFNSQDPFYPWYRWNGGTTLFEPLAIAPGTVLTVPHPFLEPPPLAEVALSPEKWQHKLASYSTSLTGSSQSRLFNIALGAERLNDTIIYPYQLFSIEQAIGPTDLSGGYKMGWGYENGQEVPMEGGGLCQIPSTLFKPAAEAGMLVIERYAHMFYSDRYGPWDATVSPVLDFTFRNIFPFPVQVRAEISQDNQTLTIDFWSPSALPYQEVNLETVCNQENDDGTREAVVRQTVFFQGQTRVRDYKSNYDPKP